MVINIGIVFQLMFNEALESLPCLVFLALLGCAAQSKLVHSFLKSRVDRFASLLVIPEDHALENCADRGQTYPDTHQHVEVGLLRGNSSYRD